VQQATKFELVPQDREDTRPRHSAVAARHSRCGDRV